MLNDFKISDNFNLREFQCKCGCEQVKLGADLLNTLQVIRNKLGKSIHITSGYRCDSYNKRIGGSKNSFHKFGRGVDVTTSNKSDLKQIIKLAYELGLKGIGYYPDENFVHLDNRFLKDERYWYKYQNKPYNYISFNELLEVIK